MLHYQGSARRAALRSAFDYGCFILFNISLFFSRLMACIIRMLMGRATFKVKCIVCPISNKLTSCSLSAVRSYETPCAMFPERRQWKIWGVSDIQKRCCPLQSNPVSVVSNRNGGKCQPDLRTSPRACSNWLLMLNCLSLVPIKMYWILLRS